MSEENAVPQKQIDDFVSRLRAAAGANLQSVILYGSAAGGEFHPAHSNINLLCVLREISFATLGTLAAAVEWWTKQKRSPPLVLTAQELERSADVFSIEFLDMRQRYRVLYGDDVLAGLKVPMSWHRAQLEYELREKIIFLRENLLLAGHSTEKLWDLLLRSAPAFATLFRHALIALGQPAPDSRRAAVEALAAQIAFDASPFRQLLDVREQKLVRKQIDVAALFNGYLAALQQVAAAVDTMLDSRETAS